MLFRSCHAQETVEEVGADAALGLGVDGQQVHAVRRGGGEEEDLPYLDDALFEEPLSAEECEKEYKTLKERERKKLEEVPKGAKKANKHYRPWEDEGRMVADGRTQGTGTSVTSQATSQMSQIPADAPTHSLSPCATEPTERTRYIFRECMKEEDVTEADLVNEGGRHNSVKVVLSHCNQLLTQAETLGMLKELMPDHWQDQNIQDLVSAYYTDYYNPSQRLSLVQKRIFKESKRIGESTQETDSPNAEPQCALSKLFASKLPPEIPSELPKLVKAVTETLLRN